MKTICECHHCIRANNLTVDVGSMAFPLSSTKIIQCPECGNKRCPHASDHTLICTDSNEPGQPGSIYGSAISHYERLERLEELNTAHELLLADNKRLAQKAADACENAPWLNTAHLICTHQGIPQGDITWRMQVLAELLETSTL